MSEAAPAHSTSGALDDKVLDLMRALKANDSDVWEGKPCTPQDDAFITQLLTSSHAKGSEEAPAAAASVAASSTDGVQTTTRHHTSSALTLDALMGTYVSQIRELRTFDEQQQHSPNQCECALAGPQQAAESAERELDFAALLEQLDALPPLKSDAAPKEE